MTAATSEPVKLLMKATPVEPGMPRMGRSRGRKRMSEALKAPSCSNTPSRPQKSMTAGIRFRPAMKPSLAPEPPEPIRLAPVSPMVPKEPLRLVMPRDTARPKGRLSSLAHTKPTASTPATPAAAAITRGPTTDTTWPGVVVARLEKMRMVTKKVMSPADWVLFRMFFSRKPRAKNTAPITRHITK